MYHRELAGADLHAPTNNLVENDTGLDIPALKVVTYNGIGTASFPSIRPVAGPSDIIRGITMMDIPPTAEENTGYITTLGFLIGTESTPVDTSAWPEGTALYTDYSGNLTTVVSGPLVATVYKQDPIYGYLYVEGLIQTGGGGGGGSGDVNGPLSSTLTAIATWNNTYGTLLQDNAAATVQSGGAVQSQGFVFNRQIIENVTVPNHYSIVSTDVELVSGDIILDGDAQLILL